MSGVIQGLLLEKLRTVLVESAREVKKLQFAVENNKDHLRTVSEALKQLSVVDSLSRSVSLLKCSLERIIKNTSVVDGCCPPGWEQFSSFCYYFSSQSLSWNDSRVWCDQHQAHLLILHDDKAWDFVTARTDSYLFWIGLSDWRTGRWEWVNQTPYIMDRRYVMSGGGATDFRFLKGGGATDFRFLKGGGATDFRRWVPGQPDSWAGHGLGPGDEDCAHLHRNGRLNDRDREIIAMTTEYRDDIEDDSSSFWNKEPRPVYFSGVSRFRRWLYPGLAAAVILIVIIALGASNTSTSNRVWSVEKMVSNLTDSQSSTQQLAKDTAKDVHRLKFAVESNKDQLTSVSEALKQLSVLDSITRTVAIYAPLRCSLERIIHNSSAVDGCCPLEWDLFGSSCYFFSRTPLSWDDARDWCNGHESHLTILITDEEWDFVTRHTGGSFYWVGLTDERTGKWEWVNQTPYIMNRRRWRPGQPDSWTGHGLGGGDEDCAHLHSDGRLNDLHCSSKLRYICQRHSQRS
ncbi:hypothetical protein L3Q82_016400 [Scortum barcoo]|uniref:Uncharacterized protein n=1 Tax=Scortum barcoo TaxID=214431 RepID=A0ACB8X819_9TELE|nr:hypothetical protein L3Q82_016400 [Scortum barcoo]